MQFNQQSKIFVAGHMGLVGSGVVRALQNQGFRNLIVRSHRELDLREQSAVRSFFEEERPLVDKTVMRAVDAVKCAIDNGLLSAMNLFNKNPEPERPTDGPAPQES